MSPLAEFTMEHEIGWWFVMAETPRKDTPLNVKLGEEFVSTVRCPPEEVTPNAANADRASKRLKASLANISKS
jgi:hypothetical protein